MPGQTRNTDKTPNTASDKNEPTPVPAAQIQPPKVRAVTVSAIDSAHSSNKDMVTEACTTKGSQVPHTFPPLAGPLVTIESLQDEMVCPHRIWIKGTPVPLTKNGNVFDGLLVDPTFIEECDEYADTLTVEYREDRKWVAMSTEIERVVLEAYEQLAKEQGIPLQFSDASDFDPCAHLEVEDNEEEENDDKE